MDKVITALRQHFTAPSADLIQQYPLCSICWNDYDGEDQPVKLPCGHVFGEECVIAWGQGTTPTGRHNGCPTCRAELLPPSLHSRTSAVKYWLSDLWPTCLALLGGPRGVALFVGIQIVNLGTAQFPNSVIGSLIRTGSSACLLTFLVSRAGQTMGWRSAIVTIAGTVLVSLCGMFLVLICMTLLTGRLSWRPRN